MLLLKDLVIKIENEKKYTTRTTNTRWFKLKREMYSINGDHKEKKELDTIIKELER